MINRLTPKTISAILFSTMFFSCSQIIANTHQTNHSISRKLLGSIEKSIDTIKRNPECLDDIDRTIEQVQKEVSHISQEIKKTLSPEQCKKLSTAINNELHFAQKIVTATLDKCGNDINQAIDANISQQQKTDLIQKMEQSTENIKTTCQDEQTKAHFKKLDQELSATKKEVSNTLKPLVKSIDKVTHNPADN